MTPFSVVTLPTAHCQITSLSTRLPFEDDTFDLVHVSHISKGVPEHKVKSSRSFILFHQLMYHFTVELPLRGAFLDPRNPLPTYDGFRKYVG